MISSDLECQDFVLILPVVCSEQAPLAMLHHTHMARPKLKDIEYNNSNRYFPISRTREKILYVGLGFYVFFSGKLKFLRVSSTKPESRDTCSHCRVISPTSLAMKSVVISGNPIAARGNAE